MDKDIDPPFDFDLHTGKRPGLFIELCPGDFEPNSQLWVSVDERVFGFVEMFLKAGMSNPGSYSHYGVNKIGTADWLKALKELHKYCDEITLRPRYDDRRWSESGYAEIDGEFCYRFEKTRIDVRRVATQLSAWTDSWSASYPNIFIHGI